MHNFILEDSQYCAMLNTEICIYTHMSKEWMQHFSWLTDGDMKKARSIIVEVSELHCKTN